MTVSMKSMKMMSADALKIQANRLASIVNRKEANQFRDEGNNEVEYRKNSRDIKLERIAKRRKTSEQAH
jgi:hypothetical protein